MVQEAAGAELGLLLRRLNVELDAVAERFAVLHGLGRTDVRALVAIMDATRGGRSLTAGALGSAVDLSSASVTALVDRLERAGHVRRARDDLDRRRVVLQMTESAMAAGGQFFGGLQRDLVKAMAGYTDEELAVVRRFLTDMTDVVGRHAQAPVAADLPDAHPEPPEALEAIPPSAGPET